MKTFDVPFVPIKDKHMIRDMHSKAVLSTDIHALNEWRDKQKTMQEIKDTQARLNNLEENMGKVIDLLQQLVNKN